MLLSTISQVRILMKLDLYESRDQKNIDLRSSDLGLY